MFCRVKTQWMVGFGGQTGLRYEALYPLLDRATSSPEEWSDLLADVQVMEAAALDEMSKKQ